MFLAPLTTASSASAVARENNIDAVGIDDATVNSIPKFQLIEGLDYAENTSAVPRAHRDFAMGALNFYSSQGSCPAPLVAGMT